MSASNLTPHACKVAVAFGIAKGWVKLPTRTLSEREIDSILSDQTRLRYRDTGHKYRNRYAKVVTARPEGV